MANKTGGRIGIVAGSGRLPIHVLESLERAGEKPFLVLVEGEASPAPIYERNQHVWVELEEFGRLVPLLQDAGVRRLVMAGGIGRRPVLARMRWTFALLRMLPRMIRILAAGDDVLLRGVIGHIEAHGIAVLGAHEVAPDLLAARGAIAGGLPSAADMRDIAAAVEAARAIGALDIGQAAVAVGGRAIALEGIEGTAALLERVAGLRGHGRLAGRQGGALAKCAKAGQDRRADLPAIGPDTVEAAFAAGLRGIALDAENAIILDAAATIAAAEARGLFIYGIEGQQ